jgi:ribosomal protein L2
MRYRNKILFFKNKFISKKFIKISLSKSGRNKGGTITVYTKKHKNKTKSPIFLTTTLFNLKFFYLKWTNFNTKTKKKYNIYESLNNFIFFLPNIFGAVIGEYYKTWEKYTDYYNKLHFGLPSYLKIIPNYYKISNILNLKKKKATYSTSSGSFCTKIPKKKKDKLLKFILPSKKTKYFNFNDIGFIGRNGMKEKKLFKPGKAGYNQIVGFKSIVRGVAMNPVDHPNGGRTKSFSGEKSPWGWIAKYNK